MKSLVLCVLALLALGLPPYAEAKKQGACAHYKQVSVCKGNVCTLQWVCVQYTKGITKETPANPYSQRPRRNPRFYK